MSPFAASTLSSRSDPATARGSAVSSQPIARTGMSSNANRNAAVVSSPRSTAPARSRHAPTTRTVRVAMLGTESMTGSARPLIRPMAIRQSRNSSTLARNRCVS